MSMLPISIPAAPASLSSTTLAAALSITHVGSVNNLPGELIRQARHIAYEYMCIREDRLGPSSRDIGIPGLERVTMLLDEYLDRRLDGGTSHTDLMAEAKAAEETLREIRCLQNSEHFFTVALKFFFESLATMNLDFNTFGESLFQHLETYRTSRDEEEDRFLKPFYDYRDQVMRIVDAVRDTHKFSRFEVEDRIKRGLLAKLNVREWNDMQQFYDLVGLRILVGNQREVEAAVALVEGAFKVHEAQFIMDPSMEHYFRIAEVESVNNKRGYRARHINVRRHCREDDHHHPTAEIQVMSAGIKKWGDIQRVLVYKDDRIPDEVKEVISAYCRSAAIYIVELESGKTPEDRPDFKNIMILNQITDATLRSDVFDRICDMDALLKAGKPLNGQTSANTTDPR